MRERREGGSIRGFGDTRSKRGLSEAAHDEGRIEIEGREDRRRVRAEVEREP